MSAIIGACLSLVCCIILVIIWFLNPKWQNLHNFISLHQIIFGTLHLWSMALSDLFTIGSLSEDFQLRIYTYLLLASMGWSVCASVVAYLKLVLLTTGKSRCEKRKAAAFSYGLIIIVKVIGELIVPNVLNLTSLIEAIAITMITIYILMSVNLFIFLIVIRSVLSCNKNIASRRGNRVISLVGVATLCDIVTTLSLLEPLIAYFDLESYVVFFFHYRLIFHTLVVLLNRTSKEYWKKRRELIKLRKSYI